MDLDNRVAIVEPSVIDQLTVRAVEPAVHAGLPEDAGAVLLIEIEGVKVFPTPVSCGELLTRRPPRLAASELWI